MTSTDNSPVPAGWPFAPELWPIRRSVYVRLKYELAEFLSRLDGIGSVIHFAEGRRVGQFIDVERIRDPETIQAIEDSPFILYSLSPKHPKRAGYERRQEIKRKLGNSRRRLVGLAGKRSPQAFADELRPGDAAHILKTWGFNPVEFQSWVLTGRPKPCAGQLALF